MLKTRESNVITKGVISIDRGKKRKGFYTEFRLMTREQKKKKKLRSSRYVEGKPDRRDILRVGFT